MVGWAAEKSQKKQSKSSSFAHTGGPRERLDSLQHLWISTNIVTILRTHPTTHTQKNFLTAKR